MLLYIHGGGFGSGSTSTPVYNRAGVARNGAMIVTINYRLGSFVFRIYPALTANAPLLNSGNNWLNDAVSALKRVCGNIANSGRHSASITMAGQSSGATLSDLLISSKFSLVQFIAYESDRHGGLADRSPAIYPHDTEQEASASMDELGRDRHLSGLTLWVDEHAKSAHALISLYRVVPAYPDAGNQRLWAFDTAEVPYIFGTIDTPDIKFDQGDRSFFSEMRAHWLAFMRHRPQVVFMSPRNMSSLEANCPCPIHHATAQSKAMPATVLTN